MRAGFFGIILPVSLAILAVGIADALSPPANQETFDSLGRDLTALLVGVVLGISAAWLIYADRGR